MSRRLAASVLLAAGASLTACGGGLAEQPAPSPRGGPGFTPYVDVTLNRPFDLASLGRESGARSLILAFITRGGRECEPWWGGQLPFDSERVTAAASRLRDARTSVRVSFGGRSGADLAQSCPTAERLATAYRSVVDRYGAAGIDFDVEGAALSDQPTAARRGKAIALLQRSLAGAGRRLTTSLTLPVAPTGLPPAALSVVRATTQQGARIDVVNLLAMDYGPGALPRSRGRMGTAAIGAAAAARRQLAAVSPSLGRWERIGLTPMIGVNDVAGEVFTLADARAVSAFARRRRLGMVSMWSLARDHRCPTGHPPTADPTCSGVGAPSRAFEQVLGAPP